MYLKYHDWLNVLKNRIDQYYKEGGGIFAVLTDYEQLEIRHF